VIAYVIAQPIFGIGTVCRRESPELQVLYQGAAGRRELIRDKFTR
jgi:hypothetical protein